MIVSGLGDISLSFCLSLARTVNRLFSVFISAQLLTVVTATQRVISFQLNADCQKNLHILLNSLANIQSIM